MTGDERHVPTADPRLQPKGDQSERILQDAFLSGGRDPSGAGKLSAGLMSDAMNDDEPRHLARDSSWGSRAEEEGGPSQGGVRGLVRRVRHYFSI
jgi:hypothetical protein